MSKIKTPLVTNMNFELQEIRSLDYLSLFGKGVSVWKAVEFYRENPLGRKTKFRMLSDPQAYYNVHIIDMSKKTMTYREWDVKANDWNEDVLEYTKTLEEFMPSLPNGMSPMLSEYQIVFVSKDRFILKIPHLLGEGQHVYRIYDKDNSLLKVPY